MKGAANQPTTGAIEAILVSRIGLDLLSVSPNLVSRGVRNRMVALGLDDVGDYEARLRSSQAEVQELVEEVVIPESWFFRDERPFRFLQEFAKQRLANPLARPLRILSLPCARGEEPLSVAMALKDAGLDPARFRIDGVDVGARNIELARRGVYSSNAFRTEDLGFRDRYFQPQSGGYQIDQTILKSVRFRCASVLDPDLLAGEDPYDVILCRNLLIYLTPDAKLQTLKTLDRLLDDDGVLLVGHADRLGQDLLRPPVGSPAFAIFGDPACFAFRKASSAGKPGMNSRVQPQPAPPLEESSFHFAAIVLPEPAHFVSSTSTPIAEDTRPLLDQAYELANQGRHNAALELIDKQLLAKGPNADAFHLIGVVSQATGDRERAERFFNKAVYLEPEHADALLALALLADRRGDASAASNYRRRAARAQSTKGVS